MAKNQTQPHIHISQNLILSQYMRLSMDTKKTRRNLNVMVIGGAGSGKSRFFVKPNLCEMPLNTSFVVTDPAGDLIEDTGTMLENFGYDVIAFNLVNMNASYHYNPLNYIHNENDVILLSDVILNNTKLDEKSGGEPFWEQSQALMIRAFISLLWLYGDELRLPKTVPFLMDLMRYMQASEDDKAPKELKRDLTDEFFAAVKTDGWYFDRNGDFHKGHPLPESGYEFHEPKGESIATRFYEGFRQAAGKTLKSIIISGISRLSALDTAEIKVLLSADDIHLHKIADKKTALFIIIPQEHGSFNFIAAMMYSQLFQSLYFHAEQKCMGNYMIVDEAGEITKILEVDHTPTDSAINWDEILQVKVNLNDIIRENSNPIRKSFFHKKTKVQTLEEQADEAFDKLSPDEDAGICNPEVEKLANNYIEIFKNKVEVYQLAEYYVLKVPDENGLLDEKHGEIIAKYTDPKQAKIKIERLKHCSIIRCGLHLPYNVSMFLDEFANVGSIPSFQKIIATCRKFKISVAIIVQALSQLKAMYKEDSETLMGNCDTTLFLGSSAYDTLEYISKRLGKATIKNKNHSSTRGAHPSGTDQKQGMGRDLKAPDELGLLDENECVIMIRGVNPYLGPKHNFLSHRNYKYTAAGGNKSYVIHPPMLKSAPPKVSYSDYDSESQIRNAMKENGLDMCDVTESTINAISYFHELAIEKEKENAQNAVAELNQAKQQFDLNTVKEMAESMHIKVKEDPISGEITFEAPEDPDAFIDTIESYPEDSTLAGLLDDVYKIATTKNGTDSSSGLTSLESLDNPLEFKQSSSSVY